MTCTLKDAYILIADHRFTQVKELLPILESVSNTDKSLLIIAEDIDNEALATLIVNKARGTIKVCAIKAPDFGDRRKLILEDIAALTGGQVFDKNKGMKLEKFSWDWFGEARAVTVTKEKTTLVDGKGKEDDIEGRIENLQNQIDNSNSPFEKEQLQNRLAKMVGGVSIIHVGGYNEIELNEKKDRVDDALNATQAALSEGIVPGGGIALLNARRAITWPKDEEGNETESIGATIVHAACAMPFEQILKNAGYTGTTAQSYSEDLESHPGDWKGFNIETDENDDFKKVGIIDPLKVTRTALENAAAVAGTVLLTECVVVEEPSEDNNNPLNGMY
jgi:chaperonin GroEL